MSPLLITALCLTMVGTSFLSGIFGMAGGMILVGILLAMLPVPEAMMLNGVTQMASNGWRGLLWWRYVRWGAVTPYILGCAAALLLWSLWRYVPSKPAALLMLGLTPFLARMAPASYRPNPESMRQGAIYGVACMTLILLTGVSGPLIDTFFLGGKLDRREIVATKAVCQIFGHAAKLIYFGARRDRSGGVNRSDRCRSGYHRVDDRHQPRRQSAAGDDGPAVSLLGQPDHHRHRRLLRCARHAHDRAGRALTAVRASTAKREPRIDIFDYISTLLLTT